MRSLAGQKQFFGLNHSCYVSARLGLGNFFRTLQHVGACLHELRFQSATKCLSMDVDSITDTIARRACRHASVSWCGLFCSSNHVSCRLRKALQQHLLHITSR